MNFFLLGGCSSEFYLNNCSAVFILYTTLFSVIVDGVKDQGHDKFGRTIMESTSTSTKQGREIPGAAFAGALIVSESLFLLRAAGRSAVRRRLEVLVNEGILGVGGAQKVYRDAFGGELKAVKDRKKLDLSRWFLSGSKGQG